MRLFTILLAVLMSAFVSANEDITNLVKGLAGAAIKSGIDKQVDRDFDVSVEKFNFKRNEESDFRLPDGSIIAFEIKSNETELNDEKLIAEIKTQVRYWAKGVGLGPNFDDRERVKERNAADRENEELRNPTKKGRAERPAWDIQITARQVSGSDLKSGSFGSWWNRIFGSYYVEKDFIELTVEFVDAETRVAPADAIFSVVGCKIRQSRLDIGLGNTDVTSETENNTCLDLVDAVKRLTKVINDPKRGQKK